ncbi:hypothetical protein HRR83_003729 [Exophiala dermatitidis]|uniref:Conserved oligomeric Golgi complex subunit 8 n=1 Tax=Exophiala dermatitidis TaxID=5970 RepID=A0AAN6EXV3_EXODE|nr:hypothetical protein HRR75_002644 [Exophiala dermatitidis]KAJ4522306.1 hypothetical protein HRR74_002889 [Exophiala dermatitidis]KAJ4529631.1 hypothetical protein HRR73_000657 [Exophiala dermatitidis]KAJ4543205.1 hypothetical protein HRR77_005462 [Exophiala dermatitidis]KAJ4543704.1 hypothetical protein HRR76_001770 [Exophiala dermatitidis]
MADPLYDLLRPHLPTSSGLSNSTAGPPSPSISKYLSRLVSLRLDDLTTTEPESLAQANQSNLVSIQALSARSHRTTTTSSDHLSTLQTSLPQLLSSVEAIRESIPALDASATGFASAYDRSKADETSAGGGNALLEARREAALLARQADKVQDILELPSLLSAAIASAGSNSSTSSGSSTAVPSGAANYSQALDLFAHTKRLQILYPDSQLVRSVVLEAEVAMREMTTNLIAGLRSQNLRLAAAIRMIGWLRRVAPELSGPTTTSQPNKQQQYPQQTRISNPSTTTGSGAAAASSGRGHGNQDEGHLGALFLCARLCTFLYMTEALAPLRELADQETEARLKDTDQHSHRHSSSTTVSTPKHSRTRTSSYTSASHSFQGQHTERYLKRYIEIFREQSFATISMYRNIFPQDDNDLSNESAAEQNRDDSQSAGEAAVPSLSLCLSLPPALQSFPLHLVENLVATLKQYLPNVTDPSARESLLMQVLYAANSLGRLGADFSLVIALLDEDEAETETDAEVETEADVQAAASGEAEVEPDAEADADAEAKAEAKEERQEQERKPGHESQDDTQDRDHEEDKDKDTQAEPEPGRIGHEKDQERQGDENTATATATAAPSDNADGISTPQHDDRHQQKEDEDEPEPEPEWVSVIKKHRVQAARLEALAAGQDRLVGVQRRESGTTIPVDIAVR